MSNQLGINPIRLGILADRFGELAYPERIDYRYCQAGRGHPGHDIDLETSGGFHDDQLRAHGCNAIDQLADAGLITVKLPGGILSNNGKIQGLLGDVNTYKHVCFIGHDSLLPV